MYNKVQSRDADPEHHFPTRLLTLCKTTPLIQDTYSRYEVVRLIFGFVSFFQTP